MRCSSCFSRRTSSSLAILFMPCRICRWSAHQAASIIGAPALRHTLQALKMPCSLSESKQTKRWLFLHLLVISAGCCGNNLFKLTFIRKAQLSLPPLFPPLHQHVDCRRKCLWKHDKRRSVLYNSCMGTTACHANASTFQPMHT